MCDFHVGQHVVCIADEERLLQSDDGIVLLEKPVIPRENVVYTISEVVPETRSGNVGLLLAEIPNQWVRILFRGAEFQGHVVFCASDFRPLRKLTVDEFMSTKVPVPA